MALKITLIIVVAVIILSLSSISLSLARPLKDTLEARNWSISDSSDYYLSEQHYCGLFEFDRRVAIKQREFVETRIKLTGNRDTGINFDSDEAWRAEYEKIVPAQFRPTKLVLPKERADANFNQVFPILINLRYDRNLIEGLREFEGGALEYIKSVLYHAQSIYEQPELWDRIKLGLVVVALKPLSEEIRIGPDASDIIDNYYEWNPDDFMPPDRTGLNVILVRRNIWMRGDLSSSSILDGLSHVCGLCSLYHNRGEKFRQLILVARSIGQTAVTLAHELAHSMNVMHDGEWPSQLDCPKDGHIMSPDSSPSELTWSKCTVRQLTDYFRSQGTTECFKNMYNKFEPVEGFDMRPDKRAPLGRVLTLDKQCQIAFDRVSGVVEAPYYLEGLGICQDIICRLGPFERSLGGIGPAMSGTSCNFNRTIKGKCLHSKCMQV